MLEKQLSVDQKGIEFIARLVELPVQSLVTRINCLPWVATNFSCGGHYDLDMPKLFGYGITIYLDPTQNPSEQFLADFKKLVEGFSPAAYIFPNGSAFTFGETRCQLYNFGLDDIDYRPLICLPVEQRRNVLSRTHGATYGRFFQAIEQLTQGFIEREGLGKLFEDANHRRLRILEARYYGSDGVVREYQRQLDHDYIKFGR